ncbi:hypothetical protein CEQ15_03550 [Chryseobacterium indologenes]|uniref:DUF1281 family ferredoxin-like fold protein n=1 Tax=Chryseobacterium indologenes TaxID=253 RepID=UPI000B51C2D3|nr:hypothetical protein [Chryseobacterium indologenes]ASE60645.1 hypothetical protein CEQ15_03550 [Chryseobacterium indologenes]
MANWCSNTVVFEGKPEAIEQIQQLFKSMAEKEQKEECGQLPDFVEDSNGGYFFDIYQDDDVTGLFQYETKWSPNIEVVQAIAEQYNVNFTQDYEELSNCVCGRATFADKLLTDIFLDDEEFEQYEFDEETDTYHFEGETYDSDCEILETLLERKLSFL